VICPSCGLRDADDEETGWCKQCAGTAVAEGYQDRKVNALRDWWLRRLSREEESA